MITCFYNALLLRDHQIKRQDLWVADDKIIPPQEKAHKSIDLQGLLIAPGYIDLQINGAAGCDFSSNAEKVTQAAKELPRYGVTSFLPTVISSAPKEYLHLLPLLQPRQGGVEGASLLGIHLEGPFLNRLYPGAHASKLFHTFEELAPIEGCYGSLEGVKIVTLAPELPGALQWIPFLRSQNIIVSAGHSAATWQQMQEAMQRGVCMTTHLFNAMAPFHHRSPGIIGATLETPVFFYSIIADGTHLHPTTVKLAWNCQPAGLVLVSDAMSALGNGEGTFSLGIQKVDVRNHAGYIQGTETFAGSIHGLDACVRNFYKFTGCSVTDALEAASLKPAQLLGLHGQKGALDIGSDADLVILNESLEVQACYVGGQCSYEAYSS